MSVGFDPTTGTWTTDRGETIGRELTRTAFLASDLGAGASLLVANEPYVSWAVDRAIGGRPFRLGLYFEGDRLTIVIAALDEPAFGRTWADWTPAREGARKAAHEAWLAAVDPGIGEGRDYAWGFVSSVLDLKSGGSEIVIRYDARLPERDVSPYPSIDFSGGLLRGSEQRPPGGR